MGHFDPRFTGGTEKKKTESHNLPPKRNSNKNKLSLILVWGKLVFVTGCSNFSQDFHFNKLMVTINTFNLKS